MGGEGSGRKPDPMKRLFPKETPIANAPDAMFIPNLSGVQHEIREGTHAISTDDLTEGTTNKFSLWEVSAGNTQLITDDDILIQSSSKIFFRDSAIFIHSNTDGEMTIEADTKVTIGTAGDTILGDSTLRAIRPHTDEKIDLGSSTHKFNDVFVNLPTSDPSVAGQLWSDSGTVKVSAG